jgi:hypothetical protein
MNQPTYTDIQPVALGLALSAYPLRVGTSAVIAWVSLDGTHHASRIDLTPQLVTEARSLRTVIRRYA